MLASFILSRCPALAKPFVRRLRDDTHGTAAVEFGLVGSLCILLIVETMQAGFYFYTSGALEFATAKAMRQVLTGNVATGGLTATQFRTTILCPLLPAAMPCSNVITNLRSVSQDPSSQGFYAFVTADQSAIIPPTMDNTQTNFCAGTTGTVIYAQVYYAMPVFSPAWRMIGATMFNGALAHFVGAASVFRNEPFQAGQAAAC